MKQYCHLLFVIPILLLQQQPVLAFPSGAGGCGGGSAAVGGSHLNDANDRPLVPGRLIDGVIRVAIEGIELSPDSPTNVPTNEDLVITVEAGDIAYLGLLIRVEAPAGVDTSAALVQGANTQVTSVCTAPIVGITHTNNDEKTMATGTIRFDQEVEGVQLDVTVVFLNSASGSAYVYSRLPVNFRNADAATTSVPTVPNLTGAPTTQDTTNTPAPTTGAPFVDTTAGDSPPVAQPTPAATNNPAVVNPPPQSNPPVLESTPTIPSMQLLPSFLQAPTQPTTTDDALFAFDPADVPSAPVAAPQPTDSSTGGFFFHRRPTTDSTPLRPSNNQQTPPGGGRMMRRNMNMMKGVKNSSKKGMMMMGRKGMKWAGTTDRPNRHKQHTSLFRHQDDDFDTSPPPEHRRPRSMSSLFFSRQ